MRKLVSLLLALLMTLSLCMASGVGLAEEAGGGKLTIWMEATFSENANQVIQRYIDAYAAETGTEIETEFISATDYMLKLNAAVEANNVPDVTIGGPYKVLSYYPNNPYMPVTDLVDEINATRPFIEANREGTKMEGENYFVPYYNSGSLLFIRKDIFEEKGVAIPTTWTELLAAAPQVSDPDNGFYGLGVGCGPNDEDCENTIRMMIWSKGGKIFDADGTVVAASDPVVREVFETYKELYDAGVIPPSATTWDSGGNNKTYLMNESAMVINAPTLYNAIANDDEYAQLFEATTAINLPGDSAGSITLAIPMGWSIMKGTQNEEGARDFIKYMCDADRYNEYMAEVVPVYAPVFADCADMPLWAEEGPNRQMLQYVENAVGYYGYPVESLEGRALASKYYFSFGLARALNAYTTGGSTLDEALQMIESEIADIAKSMQ